MSTKTLSHTLAAILLTALLLATPAAPAFSRTNEATVEEPGWQLTIHTPQGTCIVPLVTDYNCTGVPCTLTDPMIPLRSFAAALDLPLDYRCVGGVAALLWPAGDGFILLDGLPNAITLKPQAAILPLFEVPRVLDGCFCAPLSFLDVLKLDYDIDAANMQVTLYADQASVQALIQASVQASIDELWQAATPQLNVLLTPTRQLLSSATLAINADIDSANTLLQDAGKLHGTCVPPGDTLACNPPYTPCTPLDDPLCTPCTPLDMTLYTALCKAGLPQNSGTFANNTLFPLQIVCRVAPDSLTIQVYQLNSSAAAGAYLAPIAQ